ncbi:MAG: hypothetical protein IKO81_00030 [Bacteroidales bacterium]|nr:hypothetical protein [Bacteroidales bacterium]
MGEVRIISAVESAKVKAGNELPKPPALILVQWIGFIWAGTVILRLIWLVITAFVAAFGGSSDLGEAVAHLFFESVVLIIALSMFLIPFLAMCFCLKRSRYFIPFLCTFGALIAYNCTEMPKIVSIMGILPSVAVWVVPSIRKWYDSLV